MPTLIELQASLADIDAALAAPERQVTLGSQNVTYRSIDDLMKARQLLLDQITEASPAVLTGRRSRQSYAVYRGRGFE